MTRSSSMTSCINDQFCAVWRHACRSCPSASARSSAPCHSVGSRDPPRHTVSKELCPPDPSRAKALPAANGDPPISNWYHTLEPDNLRAQIRHHLLQRGVLRQQAFGQGLKVATRQL